MIKGLDVIAVTDHNSCCNCGAAMEIGEAYGVTVIPGMELTTAEEVHVLCLFPALKTAMEWDEYVYEHLIDIPNQEEIFGKQQICNSDDEIIGTKEKLLINATDIAFAQVYQLMEERKMCIRDRVIYGIRNNWKIFNIFLELRSSRKNYNSSHLHCEI